MALHETSKLTDTMIEQLACSLAMRSLKSMAMKTLDNPFEMIQNLESEHRGDFVSFNRDMLKKWQYKYSGTDEVMVSTNLKLFSLIHSVFV